MNNISPDSSYPFLHPIRVLLFDFFFGGTQIEGIKKDNFSFIPRSFFLSVCVLVLSGIVGSENLQQRAMSYVAGGVNIDGIGLVFLSFLGSGLFTAHENFSSRHVFWYLLERFFFLSLSLFLSGLTRDTGFCADGL